MKNAFYLLHIKPIQILWCRFGFFFYCLIFPVHITIDDFCRCIGNEGDDGAFRAITHWKLLFSSNEISIVEAIPETGRTHQLRVHFAHIGHPILGDDVYSQESEYIGRHALHAAYLSIPMPYSGEERAFVSDPPEDMISAAKKLGGIDLLELFSDKFNR